MKQVIFETPGLIDLNAFTTFGCNAKPNTTNPIGFFGTGLKYAMAILVREGCSVFVCRGKDVYKVTGETLDFRDKQFTAIHLVKQSKGIFARRHPSNKLPFTTELGKTWSLWQAFRELYSNTLDEGGKCWEEDWVLNPDLEALYAEPNTTYIIVRGTEFWGVYQEMDDIFYPGAHQERTSHESVEVFEGHSKYVYYRGMRVMDLEYPSVHTYNILSPIELTEDRTAKDPHTIHCMIRDHLARYGTPEQIRVLSGVPAQSLEATLNFSYCWYSPSETFQEYLFRLNAHNLTGLGDYIKRHTVKPRSKIAMCDSQQLVDWLREALRSDDTPAIRNAILYRLIPAIQNGDIELSDEIEEETT